MSNVNYFQRIRTTCTAHSSILCAELIVLHTPYHSSLSIIYRLELAMVLLEESLLVNIECASEILNTLLAEKVVVTN